MGKGKKAEVRVGEQLYRLRFDLYALEQVEEEFGGIREAFDKLRGKGMVEAIRKMFKIMANSQRDYDGLPADVTGNEISKHESMQKLVEISDAIRAAVDIGMAAETVNGEADDETHDAYLEEINAKN